MIVSRHIMNKSLLSHKHMLDVHGVVILNSLLQLCAAAKMLLLSQCLVCSNKIAQNTQRSRFLPHHQNVCLMVALHSQVFDAMVFSMPLPIKTVSKLCTS